MHRAYANTNSNARLARKEQRKLKLYTMNENDDKIPPDNLYSPARISVFLYYSLIEARNYVFCWKAPKLCL